MFYGLIKGPVLASSFFDCYGNKVLKVKERENYYLGAGECARPAKTDYPTPEDQRYFPFRGISVYEWTDYGDETENVTVEKSLSDCGTADHPCYCDSSLRDPQAADFHLYCCPTVPDCGRPKNKIYVNRPFYFIYHPNGDLDLKGNLVVNGDSTFVLSSRPVVGSWRSGFLELIKDWFDVTISKGAQIGRHIIFQRLNSFLKNSKTSATLSKASYGRLVFTDLRHFNRFSSVSTPLWLESRASDYGIDEFRDISGATTDNSYYYLVDRGKRRVIRLPHNSNVGKYIGAEDWGWTPERITADGTYLYLTSSYDEYGVNSDVLFRITKPVNNEIYVEGDSVVISWTRFPSASYYKIIYSYNNSPPAEANLDLKYNSFYFTAESRYAGVYNCTIVAYDDGGQVLGLSNTVTFFIISTMGASKNLFRLTSPRMYQQFIIGEDIVFSWDKQVKADSYRFYYSVDNGDYQEEEIDNSSLDFQGKRVVLKMSAKASASSKLFPPGNYKVKVRAYQGSKMIAETVNEIEFTVYEVLPEKNNFLGHNVYKLTIGKDADGHLTTTYWQQFLPNKFEFDRWEDFLILREFLRDPNGDGIIDDPNALKFKKPRGISVDGQYLYIADSDHNRIVRLSKNLVIPPEIASSLEDIKATFDNNDKNWQAKVSSSLRQQIDDYWYVLPTGGYTLSDPQDVIKTNFCECLDNNNYYYGYCYHYRCLDLVVADSGYRRVLLNVRDRIGLSWKPSQWLVLGDDSLHWRPISLYMNNSNLYVVDGDNARIVEINFGNRGYWQKGLVLNDTYFIYGKRGRKKYEFIYPQDIVFANNMFLIPDVLAPVGYSFTVVGPASGQRESLITIFPHNGYWDLTAKQVGPYYEINPYQNIFDSNTLTNRFKTTEMALQRWPFTLVAAADETVNMNVGETWSFWKKGPGISHCPTINMGCYTTCRGQWDWYVNAPTCIYYYVCCCSVACDEHGNCWCASYGCCCSQTPSCLAGYAITYDYYPYSAQENGVSKEETTSLMSAWPVDGL